MSISDFVKYISILSCHLCNNKICLINLMVNSLKDHFGIYLLIDSFRNNPYIVRSCLDSQLVDIFKIRAKRH